MKPKVIFTIGMAMIAFGIMIIMAAMPVAASVFDAAGILDETMLNKTIMFETDTQVTLTVVTLAQADDIDAEAEGYFNITDSDIVLVYDVKDNKIAIARPTARQSRLSDSDIEVLLEERYSQKQSISTGHDAAEYIGNIIDDMSAVLLKRNTDGSDGDFDANADAIGAINVCSLVKDGVCNQSCSGDLDCECGDGTCQYHENYLTCAEDCKMTEDYGCMYTSDGYCDRNCKGIDIDCPIDYTSPDYMQGKATMDRLELALIAMLVVLLGALIYIYMLTRRG